MRERLLKRLQHSLAGVEHTRLRIESLHTSGDIVRRDLAMTYSGLFIRSVTSFEAFLEELFVAILSGKTSRSVYAVRRVFPRLADFPVRHIRSLLLGDRRYLDWLPYHHTERRVKRYLSGVTPFEALTNTDRSSLEQIVCIRNALVHASEHARKAFDHGVVAGLVLPPRERTPFGYLRSLYRTAPDVSRFEYHCSELLRIAAVLAS